MPKDILPKVTFCPKTLCPIWQFAQEDILPKEFMPKVTICPKRTLCPRWYFAHIFEGFCPRIFGNIQKWKEIITQSQNAWWVFFGLKLAFFANFWENLCKIMGVVYCQNNSDGPKLADFWPNLLPSRKMKKAKI